MMPPRPPLMGGSNRVGPWEYWGMPAQKTAPDRGEAVPRVERLHCQVFVNYPLLKPLDEVFI